jgi:hypothetical protein
MNKLYEEYKWSELIKSEIKRHNLSIRPGSFLDILLKIAEKDKEKNPSVYIIDRSLVKKIIECALTNGYKITDSQLENCIDRHAPELPTPVRKHIISSIYFVPQEELSESVHSLDDVVNLYTEYVPTGYQNKRLSSISIVKNALLNESGSLIGPVIHEYIHLTPLESSYIRPRIETQTNLYDIINNMIQHSPLYSNYKNDIFPKNETITELTTIYILQDAGIENIILNRRKIIEIKLHETEELKKRIGINKLLKEIHLISYLIAYEIYRLSYVDKNMKETLENINRIIEDGLRSYIEDESKK